MRLSSRSLSEHGDGGPQAQIKILLHVVAGDAKKEAQQLCTL